MGKQWAQRPPPGYPTVNKAAVAAQTERETSVRFIEPRRRARRSLASQVALKHEIEAREQALIRPPISRYLWSYPAYVDHMPSGPMAYPPGFTQIYGVGPRPDHYYPGMTPKDVLLAMGAQQSARRAPSMPVMRPGYGSTPLTLRDREIASSRRFLNRLSRTIYEGEIPSNAFLFELIDRGLYAINHILRDASLEGRQLAPETMEVLAALRQFLDSLGLMLQDKNPDEKIQSFIHHAVLSAFMTAAVRRRHHETALSVGQEIGVEPVEEEAFSWSGVTSSIMQSAVRTRFGLSLQI